MSIRANASVPKREKQRDENRASIEAVDIRNYELYVHTHCIEWRPRRSLSFGPLDSLFFMQDCEKNVRGRRLVLCRKVLSSSSRSPFFFPCMVVELPSLPSLSSSFCFKDPPHLSTLCSPSISGFISSTLILLNNGLLQTVFVPSAHLGLHHYL